MGDSLSASHERLKAVTARFPDYWPGWWALSEYLAHTGPLFGTRDSDLRAALERTLALNPHLVSGLDHLLWVSLWQRDTLLSGRIVRELTALGYDSISRQETGLDMLPYYRYLDGLARSGGVIRDTASAEATVRSLRSLSEPLDPHRFAPGVAQYGFPRAQEEIRPFIARGASPTAASAFRLDACGRGRSARGMGQRARHDGSDRCDDAGRRSGHSTAIVSQWSAAWLGAVDPGVATAHRAAVAEVREQLRPGSRAELAWLDGLLAVSRNDARALAAARRSLSGTDSVTAPFLDRSLGGVLRWRSPGVARRRRIRSPRSRPNAPSAGWSRRRSDRTPFLTAVNRLAAARWLVERGDAASAEPLLTWHQAVLFPLRETREANAIIESARLPRTGSRRRGVERTRTRLAPIISASSGGTTRRSRRTGTSSRKPRRLSSGWVGSRTSVPGEVRFRHLAPLWNGLRRRVRRRAGDVGRETTSRPDSRDGLTKSWKPNGRTCPPRFRAATPCAHARCRVARRPRTPAP